MYFSITMEFQNYHIIIRCECILILSSQYIVKCKCIVSIIECKCIVKCKCTVSVVPAREIFVAIVSLTSQYYSLWVPPPHNQCVFGHKFRIHEPKMGNGSDAQTDWQDLVMMAGLALRISLARLPMHLQQN